MGECEIAAFKLGQEVSTVACSIHGVRMAFGVNRDADVQTIPACAQEGSQLRAILQVLMSIEVGSSRSAAECQNTVDSSLNIEVNEKRQLTKRLSSRGYVRQGR